MQYGLIGERLGHSFSKTIHGMIGDYDFQLKEIPKDEIDAFMRKKDFLGINVTIPYKETVIPYLSHIEPLTERIGAVNTIVNKDGALYGYNTDIYGLKTLAEKAGIELADKKVLILGSGGTSNTAFELAKELKAAVIYKVSRTGREGALTYDQAVTEHRDADIIINTTPVGMYPDNDSCPIEPALFKNLSGIIDVIYNPTETVLVRKGRALGINCANGLYMLATQAVKSAELFFDKKIDESICYEIYCAIKEKLK